MTDEYPVIIDGKESGCLRISRQGSKLHFDACCPQQSGLIRLSVYGDGKEGYLGVMQPENGGMRLRRTLSPGDLAHFPDKITYAARQGTGPTIPETIVPSAETEPETEWRRDVLGLLWAEEDGERLCAIPRRLGIARRGVELPGRVIEGTEYRIFKVGKISRS